mmetsp:Transcript_41439/g.84728  ORF Transcript_41439/g.84728 Transcript_41439/m.84728 type:complete len:398 (+) Transcript_41439:21-1214(+)
MALQTPACLSNQKATHRHLAEIYDRIETAASNKLWHQATIGLEELVKDPVFQTPGNTDLLTLYREFLADQPSSSAWTGYASKMNSVKHAALAITVSKQHGDVPEGIDAAIQFLEEVGTKLTTEKEATLLIRMEIARRTLQKGKVDDAKTLVEECESILSDFSELDASVNSAFYLVSSLLHKTLGNAGDFYKSSLLYLAYTSLDSLTDTQKQALAFDLGLAALCGDKIYQFGELLLHPILESLKGTAGQWLIGMLTAFNTGDIKAFEEVSTANAAAINEQPALVGNTQSLREKIRIFALMEHFRDMAADSRTVAFSSIATRTSLPEEEVELLLMKSLSLGLVKGSISGVAETFSVSWVQPRVMDRESVGKQLGKLTDWMDKVQRTSVFLQNETPEILA